MYRRYEEIPQFRVLSPGQRRSVLRHWRRARLPLNLPLIATLVILVSMLSERLEDAWLVDAPRAVIGLPIALLASALFAWPLHIWEVNALARRPEQIDRWKDLL